MKPRTASDETVLFLQATLQTSNCTPAGVLSSLLPVNFPSPKSYSKTCSDLPLKALTRVAAEGVPAAFGVFVLYAEVPVFVDPEHGCVCVPARVGKIDVLKSRKDLQSKSWLVSQAYSNWVRNTCGGPSGICANLHLWCSLLKNNYICLLV